ncbi:hypothetical protein RRG08_030101 [Elysia crispata]|uniref:Uncharacterized protein n=1 Tax=Elysia crispata TaxID=231223 RepID=A0AAE0ZR60_9GAST|nr:hypothetical protein RRG08_030101 [Elysia crispata]
MVWNSQNSQTNEGKPTACQEAVKSHGRRQEKISYSRARHRTEERITGYSEVWEVSVNLPQWGNHLD